MSRAVTILLLAEHDSPAASILLRRIREVAGGPCEAEVVPAAGGVPAMNAAMQRHPADDIVWADSHLRIETEGWLPKFQSRALSDPACGIIGAKILDHRGLIYSCGRIIVSPTGLHEHLANVGHGESDAPKFGGFAEVDAVLPSFFFLRREVIVATGGFDSLLDSLPHGPGRPPWLECDDLCLSARRHGFMVAVEPAVLASRLDFTVSPRMEALYQAATSSPLTPLDTSVINLWRKKWRWHPGHPDMRAVRQHWLATRICWRVGETLLDRWETDEPAVDVIVVTRNNLDHVKGLMTSLALTTYRNIRLWIHLNGSRDGTRDYLETWRTTTPYPIQLAESPVNIGHAPAVNWLLHLGKAPLVAKLDDDVELPEDWLTKLVARLRVNPYAGAVGVKVVNRESTGTLQWADYRFWPRANNHREEKDDSQYNYVSRTLGNMGCCLLYRRQAIARGGDYDISLNPSSWDDLDHQVALWLAGYEVLYDGEVAVTHPQKLSRDQCRRALTNTLGNGYKVVLKRGPGALQAIDQSLDFGGRRLDE